jgi:hypothetical protein
MKNPLRLAENKKAFEKMNLSKAFIKSMYN